MLDLRALVGNLQDNKFKGAVVVGVLRDIISTPSSFSSNLVLDSESVFVSMDVLAVDCKPIASIVRDFGFNTKDGMLEVVMRLPVIVKSSVYEQYKDVLFVKAEGTIRRPSRYSQDIALYNMRLDEGSKLWYLMPARCSLADIDMFCQGSDLCTAYNRSVKLGVMEHTVSNSEVNFLQGKGSSDGFTPSGKLPVVQKKYSFPIVTREKVAEPNEKFEEFGKLVAEAWMRRKATLAYKPKLDGEAIFKDFVDSVQSGLNGRAGDLLREYILNVTPKATSTVQGVSIVEYIIDNFSAVKEYYINGSERGLFENEVDSVLRFCFDSSVQFYMGYLAVALGIDFNAMTRIGKYYSGIGMDVIGAINENPYLLKFSGISFSDCESIAVVLGVNEIEEWVAYAKIDEEISQKAGSFCDRLDIDISREPREENDYERILSRNIYTTGNYTPVTLDRNMNLQIECVDAYVKAGFGVEYNGSIARTSTAKQEIYLYEEFQRRGAQETFITDDLIDKYIAEFEYDRGIKLEPEQRSACHNLLKYKFGALTGCAGSGKTTTIDALLYVLLKIKPELSADVHLAASTGKAAQRMREVLGRPAKTAHSLFKIGRYISESADRELSGVFVLDESSMFTIPLMAKIVRSIKDGSYCYFIGDINQLPPIGVGLPFRDAMLNLPVQVLGASKRTKSASKITENATIILESQPTGNLVPLKNVGDFILADCADDKIADNVEAIVRYLRGERGDDIELMLDIMNIYPEMNLDNVKIDDMSEVQVVTPYQRRTYSWGASVLNQRLQKVINGNAENKWYYGETVYAEGDRVIHTDENTYDLVHYIPNDDGTEYVADGELGVCNGEVGYVIGVKKASEISINIDKLLENDNIREYRSDYGYSGSFLIVQYIDAEKGTPYNVLYRCRLKGAGTITGKDLNLISLFYAGTVHKAQGSQYKVIIFAVGSTFQKNFITRNMIYTGVTRASELCIMVGSVRQGSSNPTCVDKARRENALDGIPTMYSVVV